MNWSLRVTGAQSCSGPFKDTCRKHIIIIKLRDREVKAFTQHFFLLVKAYLEVGVGGWALMPWHFWVDLSCQRKALDTEHPGKLRGRQGIWNRACMWPLQEALYIDRCRFKYLFCYLLTVRPYANCRSLSFIIRFLVYKTEVMIYYLSDWREDEVWQSMCQHLRWRQAQSGQLLLLSHWVTSGEYVSRPDGQRCVQQC